MSRSPTRLLQLASLVLLAGCASGPPADPEQPLARAAELTAAGDPASARKLLLQHKVEHFPARLRPRYELLLLEAHAAVGDSSGMFQVAERFPDRYPLSELRGQVVETLWQVASSLAQSDRGFWIFWSDRRAARLMLEHLIVRHPESPRLADALRILGDLAYAEGNYSLAQERYRDLMRRCPDSEWSPYARYRYAMSLAAGLRGPDYDLDQMEHAGRELQAFIASNPENPEFLRSANSALQSVLGWQAERHLRTAHYYRTLRNLQGQQLHLERAARPIYYGTRANAAAVAELAELVAQNAAAADDAAGVAGPASAAPAATTPAPAPPANDSSPGPKALARPGR